MYFPVLNNFSQVMVCGESITLTLANKKWVTRAGEMVAVKFDSRSSMFFGWTILMYRQMFGLGNVYGIDKDII